jgi:hypothetical protein
MSNKKISGVRNSGKAGPATIPVWAKSIRVEEMNDAIRVRGEGRLDWPTLEENLDEGSDLLRAYRKARGFYGTGVLPVHMQFANALEEDDLIGFVKRWGPIWGSVEARRPGTLSVVQRLVPLRREQKLFASAAGLMAELGENRPDVRVAADYMASMAEYRSIPETFYQDRTLEGYARLAAEEVQKLPWINFGISDKHLAESHPRKQIIHYAHLSLCHLLDRYSTILVPHQGRVDQLPQHRPEGILPVLYFMLREDYTLGRELMPCANPGCPNLFVVDGRSRECCTPACSKVVRDARYYHFGAGRIKRQKRYKSQRKQAKAADRIGRTKAR